MTQLNVLTEIGRLLIEAEILRQRRAAARKLLFQIDNEILQAEQSCDDDTYLETMERKRRLLADLGEGVQK